MSKKNFEPHYKTFTNNKDFVKVGCSYAGKMYYGIAKCHPDDLDKFNYEFGRNLAKARCDVLIQEAKLKRSREKIEIYRYFATTYYHLLNDEEIYERDLKAEYHKALAALALISLGESC